MSDDKRAILKQLLSGQITSKEARQKLNTPSDDLTVIMKHSDGTYSMGKETGLTKEEVDQRPKSEIYLMVNDGATGRSTFETIHRINNERNHVQRRN